MTASGTVAPCSPTPSQIQWLRRRTTTRTCATASTALSPTPTLRTRQRPALARPDSVLAVQATPGFVGRFFAHTHQILCMTVLIIVATIVHHIRLMIKQCYPLGPPHGIASARCGWMVLGPALSAAVPIGFSNKQNPISLSKGNPSHSFTSSAVHSAHAGLAAMALFTHAQQVDHLRRDSRCQPALAAHACAGSLSGLQLKHSSDSSSILPYYPWCSVWPWGSVGANFVTVPP